MNKYGHYGECILFSSYYGMHSQIFILNENSRDYDESFICETNDHRCVRDVIFT